MNFQQDSILVLLLAGHMLQSTQAQTHQQLTKRHFLKPLKILILIQMFICIVRQPTATRSHLFFLQFQLRKSKLIKIFRTFFGGYVPSYSKLVQKKYVVIQLPKPFITVLSADQGFGQIRGTTKKLNLIYPNVEVCVFKRSDKSLLWTTTSKSDGSYAFRNIAVDLECFISAFDPKREYNAVIADGVKAK